MFRVGVVLVEGMTCHQLPQACSAPVPSRRGSSSPKGFDFPVQESQQLDPFLICLCLPSFPVRGSVPEFWDGLQGLCADGVE